MRRYGRKGNASQQTKEREKGIGVIKCESTQAESQGRTEG